MRVAILGGHGKVALRLARLLSDRGDGVRSVIRRPEQAEEVRAAGAEPVVCDLEAVSEEELAEALGDVDAVVFAAGAGPGSGPERKHTVDHQGAVTLIAAALARGIDRYVMVSSVGADPDADDDGGFGTYLRAKGMADAALAASGLEHTIVRPVRLTDEPGNGVVALGDEAQADEISRDDVAAVLAAVLAEPGTHGLTFGASAGDTGVEQAVRTLAERPGSGPRP